MDYETGLFLNEIPYIKSGCGSKTMVFFTEEANIMEGVCGADVRGNIDYLAEIRAKTPVIGGTKDQFFGGDVFRETAEGIKDAELRLFAGETHMLPIERKKAVAEIVKKFIRG